MKTVIVIILLLPLASLFSFAVQSKDYLYCGLQTTELRTEFELYYRDCMQDNTIRYRFNYKARKDICFRHAEAQIKILLKSCIRNKRSY